MYITNDLGTQIMREIDNANRLSVVKPINLNPPGGIYGQISQSNVTFDNVELVDETISASGVSLITNMNRIRAGVALGDGVIHLRHLGDDITFSGGGHTIEDEGTPLAQRSKLNFVGNGVTVTDDSINDATIVTILASGIVASGVITDHGALTGLGDDDHPQYQLRSEKGTLSGYASLDGSTKVPFIQLPTGTSSSQVAIGNHTHTTASGVGMQGWYNVEDYGASPGASTATNDAAINSTISAIPSTGGVLYFPRQYHTGGGFTLNKPIMVVGNGSSLIDVPTTTPPISTVFSNSSTNSLFTVSSAGCSFRDIALVNNASSTPSAGAGINVTNDIEGMHYDNIMIWGFYDDLHIVDGALWEVKGAVFYNPIRYHVFAAHDNMVDYGDWSIVNSYFINNTGTPNAAVHITNGGGGKIANCKFNGQVINAIEVNLVSAQTSVLLITGNSIENFAGDGIHITTGGSSPDYSLINIVGNEFGVYLSNSGGNAIDISASNLGEIDQVIIDSNQFRAATGGSTAVGYAISLTKIDNVKIGSYTINANWTGLLTQSGCTNVVTETGTVTSVATGTGLTGGPITTTGTITLANTAVTPAVYGDATHIPQITVDQQGRITLASGVPITVSGISGSGDVVGPSSATNGHIAVFDGTTGKLIKDGGAIPSGVGISQGCRVYNSSDITVVNGVTKWITFDSELYDTDNMHSTSSNTGRITCNTAGTYLISFTGQLQSSNYMVETGFRINATTYIGVQSVFMPNNSADNSTYWTISTIYQLGAGDYVEVFVFQSSGSDKALVAIPHYSAEFMAQRLA